MSCRNACVPPRRYAPGSMRVCALALKGVGGHGHCICFLTSTLHFEPPNRVYLGVGVGVALRVCQILSAVGSLLEPPAGAVVRCVLWGLLCVACTRWSRALKEGRASGAAQHSSRMACNEGREWRQAAGTKRETGLGKGDMRCRGGPPPLASPLPRTSYIPAQGQGRRGLLVVPCEAHLQRGQGFAEGRGCASL